MCLTTMSLGKPYCHINKAIQDDPELQSITAKRKMARFIDLHDTNIAQKAEIIIEHFRANVAGCLGGKAKAMVVTSSRPAAVKIQAGVCSLYSRKGLYRYSSSCCFFPAR